MLYLPSSDQIYNGLHSLLQCQLGESLGDLYSVSKKLLDAGTVQTQVDPIKHIIIYSFPYRPMPIFHRKPYRTQEECILEAFSSQKLSYPYTPLKEDFSTPVISEYGKDDVKQLLESAKESRVQTLESMRCLRESFEAVRQAYQISQTHYNQLVSNLRNTFQKPGFQRLAELCRKVALVQRPSQEILAFKAELHNVSVAFGMEQFVASSGEHYDSALHERIDSAAIGDTIVHCILPGWRMDDFVYVRALVKTKNTETPYEEGYQ